MVCALVFSGCKPELLAALFRGVDFLKDKTLNMHERSNSVNEHPPCCSNGPLIEKIKSHFVCGMERTEEAAMRSPSLHQTASTPNSLAE
jgi:hypothetical protein